VGKVIVCSSESDVARLEQLYAQGKKVNLNVEIRDSSELGRFEPLAKTVGGFIWSPDTAVVNPRQVVDSLTRRLHASGVQFAFNSNFVVESDNSIVVDDLRIQFGVLINAAGVNADKIAHEYGVGLQLQMFPIMGSYWKTNSENLPLKTLVYPVPNPANPFLGVHFTITADGKIKLGPTVTPIPSRFGYKMWPPDSFKEMFEIIGAGISLLKGKENNLPRILVESIKSLTLEGVVGNACELVPATTQVRFWEKTIPGTRAQLVDRNRGILVQDFIVEKSGKTIHVLNGISPGWTASFPFARWVVDQYVN
jgi:L-2-hydroxyglutarate oxidase LhgO